jgi:zinc transport system substrate-binding protein
MRRHRIAAASVVLLVVLGLGLVTPTRAAAPVGAERARVRVVASFFPLAWVAEQVGGAAALVTDLTPAGTEPHDLELGADDRVAIEDADLVIVLGGGFQPAVEEAANQRDGATLVILDELGRSARARAERDPHLWLDPSRMARIARTIGERILDLGDSRGARVTRTAARLRELDADFESGLASCERDLLVSAHDAFGWLASRYGLRQEGIAGIDPEAEPKPNRLAELAGLVREHAVTTVFTEDLVSPDVAEALAREAGGVRTEVLSPLEALTREQRDRDEDYVTVMRTNLEKLRTALGCA